MGIEIGGTSLYPVAGSTCSLENAVTVKQGDTLSSIALNNHLSLQALLDGNPQISNPEKLNVGQVIYLPSGGGLSPSSSTNSETGETEVSPQPGAGSVQGLNKAAVLGRMNQCLDADKAIASAPQGSVSTLARSTVVDVAKNPPPTAPTADTNPSSTAVAATAVAASGQAQRDTAAADRFLNQQLKKVSDPKHPLHFLVEPKVNSQGKPMTSANGEPIFDWRKTTRVTESGKIQTGRYQANESGVTVQVGHQTAFTSGAPEQFTVEDADLNQLSGQTVESKGSYSSKPGVEIGGVPVDLPSAQQWERMGLLPKGTVAESPVIPAPQFSPPPSQGRVSPEAPRSSAPEPAANEGKSISSEGMGTHGAVEGAGMIIQDGINHALNQQELDKANAEYDRLRPQIEKLNQQGQWVAVIGIVDVPKIPDVFEDISGYHDPQNLNKFKFLMLQHGATREEALTPPPQPATISAAPLTVEPAREPIEMPKEGRKWITTLYTVSAPPLKTPDPMPGFTPQIR